MTITTVNPYTESTIRSYPEERVDEIMAKVQKIRSEQQVWGKDVDARISYFKVLKKNLARKENEIAELITEEMGKPISQSVAEVRK